MLMAIQKMKVISAPERLFISDDGMVLTAEMVNGIIDCAAGDLPADAP